MPASLTPTSMPAPTSPPSPPALCSVIIEFPDARPIFPDGSKNILMVEPIMVQVNPAHTVGQLQHYLALILEAPNGAKFYITDSRPEALSGKLQDETIQEAFSVRRQFFHRKLKGVLKFSPTPPKGSWF
jgi:hypothetical protein